MVEMFGERYDRSVLRQGGLSKRDVGPDPFNGNPPRTASALAGIARERLSGAVYPRPTNGILVAMMVMNCTLVSSGRLAM